MQIISKIFKFSSALVYGLEGQDITSKELSSFLDQGLLSEDPYGYNFTLQVQLKPEGESKFNEIKQQISRKYDHVFLNKIDHLKGKFLTFELLLLALEVDLKRILGESLYALRLILPEGVGYFKASHLPKIELSKKYKINCVHRHHNPDLSKEENKTLYGKCSEVHGHQYDFSVQIEGELSSFNQVFSWQELDGLVQKSIIDPFHNSYLNEKMGNTSGELIIEKLFLYLIEENPSLNIVGLSLYETKKNSFFKLTS